MRFVILSSVVAALLLSGSAHAQEWINYEDRAWGFSINFPHEPKMEQIGYKTFFGQTVPARVYSAERGSGRYSLTVVYFCGRANRFAHRRLVRGRSDPRQGQGDLFRLRQS